jgi:plasmid stabilization system protein ParE
MARVVRLTPEARDDLIVIQEWQTQPGAGAAARPRLRSIVAAINRLDEHPCLHARSEHRGTREFSVARHRVVYQVHRDTGSNQTAGDVLVLRIFGPGQDRSGAI